MGGRIEYHAPTTLEDAIRLLGANGPRARMLAGGTDLIVQVRESQRDWDVFVDAKHIHELMSIQFAADGALTLGAAVPCYRIYADAHVRRGYPALVDAASIIGGIGIQGRASIGGNLCNAGPAGDSIPALIVHRALCIIAGPAHRRTLPVEEFCTAPGRSALRPDELLVALSFPNSTPGSGAAYLRFIPREEMDIAVVGAAAFVVLDGDVISDARIAIGAVAPTPLFVPEAANALIGKRAGPEAFAAAAVLAQSASRPITDMRGTAEHRRQLVGVLVRRSLQIAVERARGAYA